MDATCKLFLEILKAVLQDQKPAIDRKIVPEEWQKLFYVAGMHKVTPLIFEAVYPLAKDQPYLATVKRQVMQQVMMQTMRTAEFLELNKRLQEAGIRPLVVKGIVCRELYPQPDHRPSSDEDVLIPEEQFDMAYQVLTDYGMHTTEAPENLAAAYEVPFRKTGSSLYIELHKHLFPPESEAYADLNHFFEGVFERAVGIQAQGSTVYTLDDTDHLFYLICHAFKHFLHSGFGIRQVCDIALFANAYGERIDWLQVLDNCKAIRAEKFAAALFQIGSKYLTFDPDKAMYPDAWRKIRVDEMPMLEDLLSAGVYGSADESRLHSSNITLDAVAAQKQGKMARGAVAASVFPSAEKLEHRYPYLKKRPWLLPVAWCSRLWGYAKEMNCGNKASDALKIGNERVELMKVYGILE